MAWHHNFKSRQDHGHSFFLLFLFLYISLLPFSLLLFPFPPLSPFLPLEVKPLKFT